MKAVSSLALGLIALACVACGDAPLGDSASTADGLADNGGADFTLWIHGYSPLSETAIGSYGDFDPYFGGAGTSAGAQKRAVNWGGRASISTSNVHVRNALDCFCTGESFCAIATHSTGDSQIGYALAHYAATPRTVRDPKKPRADGTCDAKVGGGTQTGWNIRWVVSAGAAGGGSELAPIGAWLAGAQPLKALKHAILQDLNPPRMRTLYDHNKTGGRRKFLYAGSNGIAFSALTLPGQDDQVVAYHSSGGVSQAGAFCNPGESLMCDGALTRGTGPTSNGVRKWSEHEVVLLDTGESYSHHLLGGWRGITGPAREYVAANAQ